MAAAQKLFSLRRGYFNNLEIILGKSDFAVQAGTPMAVNLEDRLASGNRGEDFICLF